MGTQCKPVVYVTQAPQGTFRLQATIGDRLGTVLPMNAPALSPGLRLKTAITESGYSQRRVAIAIGKERQAITNAIRRDRVSADLARAVAAVTGHRWEWLLSGEEPRRPQENSGLRLVSHSLRRVPVISLSQAAGWPRSVRERGALNAVAIDDDLANSLSDTAFCMSIEDDSMRDNSSESVQRGDRVIVDPDVQPKPGDLVVATIAGQPDAVFRKYRERSRGSEGHVTVELIPLNADYAPATIELGTGGRIIGVMVEHRRTRRHA